MKDFILTISLILLPIIGAHAQKANNFSLEKFEKELIKEMSVQFPGMTLDTTLNFAARAKSQEEAGFPECYGTKKGGMVNTMNGEKEEAIRLVTEYKSYLKNTLSFDDAALKRCRFTEFCATGTKENGMVRYGLIIDNNITRESIIENSKEVSGEQ
jgi:hypothetical protein